MDLSQWENVAFFGFLNWALQKSLFIPWWLENREKQFPLGCGQKSSSTAYSSPLAGILYDIDPYNSCARTSKVRKIVAQSRKKEHTGPSCFIVWRPGRVQNQKRTRRCGACCLNYCAYTAVACRLYLESQWPTICEIVPSAIYFTV